MLNPNRDPATDVTDFMIASRDLRFYPGDPNGYPGRIIVQYPARLPR